MMISRFPKATMLFLVFLVGIGGGIGAVLFHYLIELFQFLFYGTNTTDFLDHVVTLPWYLRLLIPALGGLIVGILLSHKQMRDAEGEGVPEVIEAVALEQSKIRPLIGPVKAVVSAISIGSGGAGGREGPVIQIGSALGSSIGQVFKCTQEDTRTLLAAGAAAAIGGTFSAPIAGIIFAYEILLKRLSIFTFLLLALAASIGTVVSQVIMGHPGSFSIPTLTTPSYTDMLLIASFGVCAAGIAILFTHTLSHTELAMRALHIPHFAKPALGGLLLGILALFIPAVHEPAAYGVITEILLNPSLPLLLIAVLVVAKIIATSLTVGSGGSGGILAPSLLIGALSGTLYAKILAEFGMTGNTLPFAVVGMGAVFAGTSHAPLTAIVLIFEFTDSFQLLAPLIIACYSAAFLAERFGKRSVYSLHHAQK